MTLRPEAAGDADFLRALFVSHAVDLLAPARLRPGEAEALAGMQHRSQTATHAALHPQARRWIALDAGAPAGRLVEADTADGLRIVDLAVAPVRLRQGIGAAMLHHVLAQARARGAVVRAEVAPDNAASLALFARSGFEVGADGEAGRLHLTWSSPSSC